eukprot:scaffold233971_cov46-Prasinocladus_malaysianus.AAC.1
MGLSLQPLLAFRHAFSGRHQQRTIDVEDVDGWMDGWMGCSRIPQTSPCRLLLRPRLEVPPLITLARATSSLQSSSTRPAWRDESCQSFPLLTTRLVRGAISRLSSSMDVSAPVDLMAARSAASFCALRASSSLSLVVFTPRPLGAA